MDILLDTATHDIKLTTLNGQKNITLSAGEAGVAQDWKVRMWTFLGEWFLDQRVGVPYFENVLVKNPDLTLIESVFREVALSTSGIETVTDITLDFDPTVRQLEVSIAGTLESGIAGPDPSFAFTFNELILPQPGVIL